MLHLLSREPVPQFFISFIGFAFVLVGFINLRITARSSTTATPFSIEDFEAGKRPEGNYIVLGKHVCLYAKGVYNYQKVIQTVDHTFYPVISEEAFNRYQSAPSGTQASFAVLVRTNRWRSVPDLKKFVEKNPIEHKNALQGLIVNGLKSLDHKEEVLLKEGFPTVDLKNVVILEAGGHPQPIAYSLGEIVAGCVFLVIMVPRLIKFFRKEHSASATTDGKT